MYKYNFLRKMNIIGWGEIEPIVIAGLVLKSPVLLIGHTGDGKTFAIKRIAQAMGIDAFQNYDASKALFDDMIGFPRFDNKSGIVEYAKTPFTLWDKEFIFIDEISRALPEMQNKWLEVIISKELMGVKLKKLKYIFLAMNPIAEYSGVYNLDYALIERFYAIIKVPCFNDMQYKELSKIAIINDAAKIKQNNELIEIVNNVEQRYKNVKKQKAYKIVANECINMLNSIEQNELHLSKNGRRLNILTKMITVLLILENKRINKKAIQYIFEKYLEYLLPFHIVFDDKEHIKTSIYSIINNDKGKIFYNILYYLKKGNQTRIQTELAYIEHTVKSKEKTVKNDINNADNETLRIMALLYFFIKNRHKYSFTIVNKINDMWLMLTKRAFISQQRQLSKVMKIKFNNEKYEYFKNYLKEIENVYKNVSI